MGETKNKEIVTEFLKEIGAGNVEPAFEYLADDIRWWLTGSLPTSGTFVGKQAILEDMMGQAASLVDPETMSLEVKSMMADKDRVAVEWVSRFKTIKGKDYENFYFVLFELCNGKIQSIREYMDTLYAKEVIFS